MSFDLGSIQIIVMMLLSIIIAVNTFGGNKKDDGKEQGVILNEIEYVKRGVDDVRFEQRDSSRKIENKLDKINDTVIRHESEIKALQQQNNNK